MSLGAELGEGQGSKEPPGQQPEPLPPVFFQVCVLGADRPLWAPIPNSWPGRDGFHGDPQATVTPVIAPPTPLLQNPKGRREGKRDGEGQRAKFLAWEDLEVLIPNRELILWREHVLTSQCLCLQPRMSNYLNLSKPKFPYLQSGVGKTHLLVKVK